MSESFGLAQYDAMRRQIALVHSLDEVKEIRDRAEALRKYARQTQACLEDVNRLVEIKLRAERRAGEMVTEMDRAQGKRTDIVTSDHDGPKLSLKEQCEEAGVSKTTARRWQTLAELPDDRFDAHIVEIKAAGGELSTNHMLRQVQVYRREVMRERMKTPGAFPRGKYRVFYADPPWQFGNDGVKSEHDNYGVAERHYPTMPTIAICDQGAEIRAMATTDAVLFLWGTTGMLPDALEVMAAWGFTYKTHFIWHKMRHNYGPYSSVRHELLLLGTKGSCLPDIDARLPSVVDLPRTNRHSEKPEEFRALIDRLYPYGPRIELFSRRQAAGSWAVWGNEVEPELSLAAD